MRERTEGLTLVARGLDGRVRVFDPQEVRGGRAARTERSAVRIDPLEVTVRRDGTEHGVAQRVEVHNADLQRGRGGAGNLRVRDVCLEHEGLVSALVDRGIDRCDGRLVQLRAADHECARGGSDDGYACSRHSHAGAGHRGVRLVVELERGRVGRDVRRVDVEDHTRENDFVQTVLRVAVWSSRDLELTDVRDSGRHVGAVGVGVGVRDRLDLAESNEVLVTDDAGACSSSLGTNEYFSFRSCVEVVAGQGVAGLITTCADCTGTRGVVRSRVADEPDLYAGAGCGAVDVCLHAGLDEHFDIGALRNDELAALHLETERFRHDGTAVVVGADAIRSTTTNGGGTEWRRCAFLVQLETVDRRCIRTGGVELDIRHVDIFVLRVEVQAENCVGERSTKELAVAQRRRVLGDVEVTLADETPALRCDSGYGDVVAGATCKACAIKLDTRKTATAIHGLGFHEGVSRCEHQLEIVVDEGSGNVRVNLEHDSLLLRNDEPATCELREGDLACLRGHALLEHRVHLAITVGVDPESVVLAVLERSRASRRLEDELGEENVLCLTRTCLEAEQVDVLAVLDSDIARACCLDGDRQAGVGNALRVTRDGSARANVLDFVAGGQTFDLHLVDRDGRTDVTTERTTDGVGASGDVRRLTTDMDAEGVATLRVVRRAVVDEVDTDLVRFLSIDSEVIEAVDTERTHARGLTERRGGRQTDAINAAASGLVAELDVLEHFADVVVRGAAAVIERGAGAGVALDEDEHLADVDALTTCGEDHVCKDCFVLIAGVALLRRAIDFDGELTGVNRDRGRQRAGLCGDRDARAVELSVHAVPVEGADSEDVRGLLEVHLHGVACASINVGNDIHRHLVAFQNGEGRVEDEGDVVADSRLHGVREDGAVAATDLEARQITIVGGAVLLDGHRVEGLVLGGVRGNLELTDHDALVAHFDFIRGDSAVVDAHFSAAHCSNLKGAAAEREVAGHLLGVGRDVGRKLNREVVLGGRDGRGVEVRGNVDRDSLTSSDFQRVGQVDRRCLILAVDRALAADARAVDCGVHAINVVLVTKALVEDGEIGDGGLVIAGSRDVHGNHGHADCALRDRVPDRVLGRESNLEGAVARRESCVSIEGVGTREHHAIGRLYVGDGERVLLAAVEVAGERELHGVIRDELGRRDGYGRRGARHNVVTGRLRGRLIHPNGKTDFDGVGTHGLDRRNCCANNASTTAIIGVGETLIDAEEHDDHFCAVHVVAWTNTTRGVVTLQNTVIGGSLDRLRVPLAGGVVRKLRSGACGLEAEGTNDKGSCLCAVNVGAGACVAGATAVAVAIATNPLLFCGFLDVRVVPSRRIDVVETTDGWRRGEETTVEHDEKLHELRAVGVVATTEARLARVEDAVVSETGNCFPIPDPVRHIGVRENAANLAERDRGHREACEDFLKARNVHKKS